MATQTKKRKIHETNSETDDDVTVVQTDSVDVVKKKKCVADQKFLPSYHQSFLCLTTSRKSAHHVYCTLCTTDISVKHGGLSDCKRHCEGKSHKEYADGVNFKGTSRLMTTFFQKKTEDSAASFSVEMSVRKAVYRQERKSVPQNGVDADHTGKVTDGQADTEVTASPQHGQSFVCAGQFAAGVTGGHIIQLLQSKTYDQTTGNQINQLWLQMEDAANQCEFASLDQHCLMLMMADNLADPGIFRNTLHHCVECMKTDLLRIQHSNTTESAHERLKSLGKFLKMSLVRRPQFTDEDATAYPSVADLLMTLLSFYLDLFVTVYRETAPAVKEERRVRRLGKQVMAGAGEKALDAVLHMSATHHHTACLSPLLRYLLKEKPPKKHFSHYLRYVLTVCKWRHLGTELDDIVAEARMTRAPKGFVDWIKRWNPDASHHFPDYQKFKGCAVTAFLLDDADENVISSLLKTLSLYERGKADTDSDREHKEEEDLQEVQSNTVTSYSKKESEKKQKLVTINKEEPVSNDEDMAVLSVDDDNTEAAKENICSDDGDDQELDDNVEVFDWTNLQDTETLGTSGNVNDDDLFMTDKGEKQSAGMAKSEVSESPKKKKKVEVTPTPDTKPESENAAFFIDRGQKKKAKKQTSGQSEESGTKSRKLKKNEKELEGGEGRDADKESADEVRGVDKKQERAAGFGTVGSESGEERKRKKKKKSKIVLECSTSSAVTEEMMEETDLTEGCSEKSTEHKKKRKVVDTVQAASSSSPVEGSIREETDFSKDETNPPSSSTEPRVKKKTGSEALEPSTLNKNLFESQGFFIDRNKNNLDTSAGTSKERGVGCLAEQRKGRRSRGDKRESGTQEQVDGSEKRKGTQVDSHVQGQLDTLAHISAHGEKRNTERKSSPLALPDRATVGSKFQTPTNKSPSIQTPGVAESTPKNEVSEDSTSSQGTTSQREKRTSKSSSLAKPASGHEKQTPSENVTPEQELSAKRKRKLSHAIEGEVSPVTRSVSEIAQSVRMKVETWSESSGAASPKAVRSARAKGSGSAAKGSGSAAEGSSSAADRDPLSRTGTATQDPSGEHRDPGQKYPPDNESFVAESVSDADSEVAMVPDLGVHLKTKSPVATTRPGGSLSVEESIMSPVFSPSEKSSGTPGTAARSSVDLTANTRKTSGQKEKQGTVSPERDEGKWTAGGCAKDQEPEEIFEKSKSTSRDAQKRMGWTGGSTRGVEDSRHSPVEVKKSSAGKERRKSSTEDLNKGPDLTDQTKCKSSIDIDRRESPAEKTRKRKRSVKEVEGEDADLKTKQPGSASVLQDGAKPKTPKSTTPVSRRTRSCRKSVIPTTTKTPKVPETECEPAQETNPHVKAKLSKRAADVGTESPQTITKAGKDTEVASQTNSDTAPSSRSLRSKTPTPLKGNSSAVIPAKTSATGRHASLPERGADGLYSTCQKRVTRKLTGPQAAHSGADEERKSTLQPDSKASFTRLKPVPENPGSPAKKSLRTLQTVDKKHTKETKERGECKSLARKSSAGVPSPGKSPSSLLTSVSPDMQTQSQSCKKGYNLRRSTKVDQ